jgi:hypothetical protein
MLGKVGTYFQSYWVLVWFHPSSNMFQFTPLIVKIRYSISSKCSVHAGLNCEGHIFHL